MSKIFKKEIDKGISEMCKAIGFKKKQYCFIKPIGANTTAVLNFGMVTHQLQGHIYINVSVGVSNKNVEALYVNLTQTDNRIFTTTIKLQIGYLTPEDSYKEWDFIEGADNTTVFEDILEHIQSYGFAYFEKMKDFDNLFKAFEVRSPGLLNISRDKRLPILYYIRGEKEKGIEFINEAIERMSRRPTDEELLAGRDPQSTIILRAGEGPKLTGDEMEKMLKSLPSGGSLQIVGAGCNGEVDPEYLKFAERYKAL